MKFLVRIQTNKSGIVHLGSGMKAACAVLTGVIRAIDPSEGLEPSEGCTVICLIDSPDGCELSDEKL